jgi:tight adherence protein C
VLFFVIAGLVLLGAGVMLVLRGVTSPGTSGTSETIDQIESYGFAATSADTTPAGHHPLTTVVGVIGGAAQRLMGTGERGIRRQLLAAGMYEVEPATVVGYRILALVGASLLWIWMAAVALQLPTVIIVLGTALFAAIGWMLPMSYLNRRARHRTETIERELPELIDLLVVTLEAGLSFLASLHMAAERLRGPLGEELRLALHEQRLGLTANDALHGMLRRSETPALRTFVRSVIQGETLGVSTGQIMRNLALEMRKNRRAKAEERAQKAPLKMLFPLIFLIFPAMFIVLLGPAVYSFGKIFNQ